MPFFCVSGWPVCAPLGAPIFRRCGCTIFSLPVSPFCKDLGILYFLVWGVYGGPVTASYALPSMCVCVRVLIRTSDKAGPPPVGANLLHASGEQTQGDRILSKTIRKAVLKTGPFFGPVFGPVASCGLRKPDRKTAQKLDLKTELVCTVQQGRRNHSKKLLQ